MTIDIQQYQILQYTNYIIVRAILYTQRIEKNQFFQNIKVWDTTRICTRGYVGPTRGERWHGKQAV